jgi:hypothetical protein
MLWPEAMAGVVGYARHPTTPRWPLPALPLLIQGGEFSQYIFFSSHQDLNGESFPPRIGRP